MSSINSKLDANQVLKQAYDEENQRLKVDAQVSASISDIIIQDPDGNELEINPDGSINANIVNAIGIEVSAADGDNVAISDGTDTLVINPDGSINVSQNGTWNINNVSGTISLPTGAATSALQSTTNTTLSSIDNKVATAANQVTANSHLSNISQALSTSQFGTSGNLGAALNSNITIQNTYGYSSIGFYVVVPTGGEVTFQGSFDGVNFENITLRGVTSDGYVTKTRVSGSFIGSISAIRTVRFLVTIAGSTTGSVIGNMTFTESVQEGAEHKPPPHKFGFSSRHLTLEASAVQTNAAVWTPTTGKRFVVTDVLITTDGTTPATLTLFDQTNAATNYVLKGYFDPKLNPTISMNLKTPYVSSATNNVLRVTTSAAISFILIVYGYEID